MLMWAYMYGCVFVVAQDVWYVYIFHQKGAPLQYSLCTRMSISSCVHVTVWQNVSDKTNRANFDLARANELENENRQEKMSLCDIM